MLLSLVEIFTASVLCIEFPEERNSMRGKMVSATAYCSVYSYIQ